MEVSGSDFLKWLIEMFQLEYRVDGTTFRLEHVSWFQRPTGIDTTTIPLSNYTKKSRKYSYTADALPSKETYQFMEASNADFVGVPIIYNSDCVTKEAKKQIVEHVVDNVTTDVEYVISNPSSESKKIDDSGIVIMSCRRTDTSWIINSMPGILDIQRLNNPFSWAILQDSYHRHKRPFRNGVMNRQQTTFTTVIPTKVGSTITIPLCCGTAFDPFATVKTELGEGVVDKAAYILNGEALELDIKYVADDGLITNTPPIATPVEAYTYVNTPVYIPIGASFSDADGDIVRPSLGNGLPSHGIASLVTYNGDSNYIYYVPESGYVGTDFIYFRGMDIYGEYSNQSYVRLTIRASNQPPTAVTDTYIVEYNTALNVSAANGLLANDTDDYTPRANLGVIGNSTPSSGSVVVNANGSFVYTPALNYTGPATFTYTVQDGGGLTSVGTVNLTIRNLSGPVARADAYNTSMGGLTFWASGIGVLANDYSPNAGLRIYSPIGTYPVTYTTTQGYTISMDSDGAFRYTRPSGFSGTDTFLYTCTDNTGAQNSATVTINVFPPVYIRLVRSNVTPGVSTVVRCDSGSGPTMTQRIRKSTADYTLYFYSDAEGTVPINVSAFGLILNFKRVTYDNINNITYTGTWSQTVPTSATASYLIWPDSVTAYSETECMVGSGGMGNAIFDESYVVTLDNGSNYYVIS
jgi:hypothetical protein